MFVNFIDEESFAAVGEIVSGKGGQSVGHDLNVVGGKVETAPGVVVGFQVVLQKHRGLAGASGSSKAQGPAVPVDLRVEISFVLSRFESTFSTVRLQTLRTKGCGLLQIKNLFKRDFKHSGDF